MSIATALFPVADPVKDAAAFQPLVDKAMAEAVAGLADRVAPALGAAIGAALAGLTITISINKK